MSLQSKRVQGNFRSKARISGDLGLVGSQKTRNSATAKKISLDNPARKGGNSVGEKQGVSPTGSIRINKFLALAGICSRREADRFIEEGKVTINGKHAVIGDKVSEKDKVNFENKPAKINQKKIYIAFHKPFGVITTTDPNCNNNIIEHIAINTRIFPVGRLDVQSSGLILLTNDGEIVNKISKAQHHHEKEYLVTVDEVISAEFIKKMESGVHILEQKTLPAKVVKISPNQFSIVIVQGLNRQIRRMCEALGFNVKILKRVRIMNIELGELKRGKWRYLTPEEESTLLKTLDEE